MTNNWPTAKLSAILVQDKDYVYELEPKIYPKLSVKLYGKGVELDTPADGSLVRMKRHQLAKAGQVILSEIWAKKGAIGIVPKQGKGALVTSHFFLFDIREDRIIPSYMKWLLKGNYFARHLWQEARGTTGYAAIRPKQFLEIEILLPPLDEQRRIVARIEELAAKVEQAQSLRKKSVVEVEALFSSAMNKVWGEQDSWKIQKIGEVSQTVSGQVDPQIEPYANLPHINGQSIESGTCRLLPYQLAKEDGITSGKYHFPAGSILYSKIRPYLRKAVQVPVEGVCSADIYAFETIDPILEPRFFMYSLISPDFTQYANRLSGRTRMPKLNQKQLFAYRLRYPPLPEQRRIVVYLDNLQAKVEAVKRHQAATAAKLDALLPSILDKAFKGEL